MRIQHNIAAQNSYRNRRANTNAMSKNLEKLSSGYRINRSGDDAAGLAVSEKMRFQITGMDRCLDNAREGINLIKTAEGALTEVHDMLDRMISLATQSANGTYTQQERDAINGEFSQLKTEIDRIGESSNFNGIPLFRNGGNAGVTTRQTNNYTFRMDLAARTCRMVSVETNAAIGVNRASGSGALDYSEVPVGFKELAEKIATEYFPNAIAQIFDAFPSLEAKVGSDTIDMRLEIGNIDGASGTLAFARYSFYSSAGSKPIDMMIKVDSSDFSDASLTGGDLERLESTLAHELMHSVMQYTLTDGMSGRTGDKFPTWFTEGTAQLAGGGFPTNWNAAIEHLVNGLSSGDGSKDSDIRDYLAAYTVDGRPYGHGYLAAAYLGYLANGGGAVTGDGIADGMDKIFEKLAAGKTLYQAVSETTGIAVGSTSELTNYLNSLFTGKGTTENTKLVTFVRELAIASQGGAGSVIADSLADGGGDIVGTAATSGPFTVVSAIGGVNGNLPQSSNTLQFTVGVNGGADVIKVDLFEMNSAVLELTSVDIRSAAGSNIAISTIKTAVDTVSTIRGYYGAIQNRLEHTINNIGVMSENLTESESTIRDTDVAEEMMRFTKNNILSQSAQAMLAQANTVPEGVLALLR